jgi:signal transduction histidine kinase/CheY-like chemotaxis protein
VGILAVDDDEKNLRALSALLAGLPARLVLARSGDEALRQLLHEDFAVILLDVQMPGLGGLETAALIRERERSRRTPIIFLTAFDRSDDQLARGYALGAVDFLSKPILPETILRDKVAWFLEARRQSLALDRERARAAAAERHAHERAVAEAKRQGEAAALRSEMAKQQQLLERLNRVNERLEVLSGIASGLLLSPAPLAVLPRLFHALSVHLGLEVYLLHLAGDGALALESSAGLSAAEAAEIEGFPPDDLAFAVAAATRAPVVVEELADAPGRYPALRLLRLTAAASYPLLAGDRLLGVITFGTRQRPRFDAQELSALELTADQVAMALERSRLIAELSRRAVELAEADRRKDDFLAMLAHELRNPLAPIVSGLDLLRRDGSPAEARRRALDAAERQVRHLTRLVGDLLDVARIRTGKVELRRAPVDLLRAVEDAVAAVEPIVRAQEQELAVALPGAPLRVEGDAVRLTQIVENLLHNAAKYTAPGGHLRLEVRRDGAQAVVHVSDDGIGMSAELLPRIFDTFVQGAQPASRAPGGLGLGLTLVRSLVERHGGSVTAASAGEGLGSSFEVRLPALAEEGAREAPPADGARPPARTLGPLRIAIIEDNADIRETLRELLVLRGHDVVEAGDGPRGVELVLARRPDVALVDIGLPGLDGYEVARRLRGASPTCLVALTGYGGEADRARAASAGFDAHLVKPVDLDALTDVLATIVPARGAAPCPAPTPAVPAPGGAEPCAAQP